MEIRQLEAFAAVMTSGSVTGAARLLDRSQPAITRLVQELEAEIGYALFVRSGPRVTPTEQAYLLYGDVERALGGLRHIRARAADIARGSAAQPLVLASTSALAVGLMPQALRALEARYGSTPVRLRSAAPEQVVQDVLNGVVQLGASSLPLEHKGLQVLWLGQAPCVAVIASNDPLAALPVVPLAALAQRRIVTMSNPYRLRHRLNAVWPQAAGAADAALQQPFIETNSSINAQALVRAGLGVAVLEPLTALGAPAEGVVVRPLDLPIPFDFGVVVPAGRPISEPVQALANALLLAAQAVPGFVQHNAAEQARLLQGKPATPELTDNF
jgi:DNA-binding transcriptional LysR family regulator